MDLKPGPRSLLPLICLLPLAAAGCGLMSAAPFLRKPTPAPPPAGEPPQASRPPLRLESAANLHQTDFHSTVTRDQEINVHLELGRSEEGRGNFEGAVAAYKKALDACGRHKGLRPGASHRAQEVLAHRRLGGAFDHLGLFPQAEEHYRAAAALAPDDPRVWNDLGYSHYLQGHWQVAEDCLTRAAALAPNDPRIQTNLGFALAAAGKTGPALEHLSRVGGSAVGHANLGYLLAALGRPDEARAHYRQALDQQPQMAVARQALAKLDTGPAPGLPATALASRGTPAPGRDAAVRQASAATNIPLPKLPGEP